MPEISAVQSEKIDNALHEVSREHHFIQEQVIREEARQGWFVNPYGIRLLGSITSRFDGQVILSDGTYITTRRLVGSERTLKTGSLVSSLGLRVAPDSVKTPEQYQEFIHEGSSMYRTGYDIENTFGRVALLEPGLFFRSYKADLTIATPSSRPLDAKSVAVEGVGRYLNEETTTEDLAAQGHALDDTLRRTRVLEKEYLNSLFKQLKHLR